MMEQNNRSGGELRAARPTGAQPLTSATMSYAPLSKCTYLPQPNRIKAYSIDTLVELLQFQKESLLLLDCRSFVDFNKMHIVGAINMPCPTLIIKRIQQRCLARRRRLGNVGHRTNIFEQLISSVEVREQCRKGLIGTVILYGESSCDPREDQGCPLYTILQLLEHERPAVGFLAGGIWAFHQRHNSYCCVQAPPDQPPMSPVPSPSARLVRENMALEPIEVLPYLYLGNQRHSRDLKGLTDRGIRYVLNVAKECQNPPDTEATFVYKNIPLLDTTDQDLHSVFEDCINFVETARHAGTKVLVHCVGGVSRSVAVTLAYLMRTQHITLDTAYGLVKQRKATISPNLSFMGQLLEFEKGERLRRTSYSSQGSGCGWGELESEAQRQENNYEHCNFDGGDDSCFYDDDDDSDVKLGSTATGLGHRGYGNPG